MTHCGFVVQWILFIVSVPLLQAQTRWNAVRPFITDDARVVGGGLSQLESWTRFTSGSSELWLMGAMGPTPELELSVGGVTGIVSDAGQNSISFALPLIQAKYLFNSYGPGELPGIAAVLGTFLPFGSGELMAPSYGTFGFATISQCFGELEDLLLHLNLGINILFPSNAEVSWLSTWGVGMQLRTYSGFHLVGEIFSGDPYVPGSGVSWQGGFRHFFSDNLQIDGTIGKGISGENILPLWVSAGIRIVFGDS